MCSSDLLPDVAQEVGELHGDAELAEAMARDVLVALAAVPGLDDVVVVTAEPRAARAAEEVGAVVIHDPEEAGQSAAARRGIAAARADRVLLVPGDCPALDPGEVVALLTRQGRAGVVIVPDRHGAGTNALLLSPPDVIEPSFGPGSFARHAARAHAAGTVVRVAEIGSLGLDVDTPDDLRVLRAVLAARPGGAARTRELLTRMRPAAAAAG